MSSNNRTVGRRPAPSVERQTLSVDTASESSKRPYTVALFILGGIGNPGNDATLKAMMNTVKRLRPDVRIVCICGNPEEVSRLFNIPAVSIWWPSPDGAVYRFANRITLRQLNHLRAWYRTLSYLGGLDAIIIPGTGVLDDYGDTSLGWPYRLLMWCAASRLRGVPIAFVSVGAGPIKRWSNRVLMLMSARLARYRSYRDKDSNVFMRNCGFDDGAGTVYPDLVLGLPLEDIDVEGPPASHADPETPKVIGVAINDYYGWSSDRDTGKEIHREYVDKNVELISKLIRKGHRIRILAYSEDEPLIDELREALGAVSIDLDEPGIDVRIAETLSQQASDISGTDIVIAARFHTIVTSLMLSRPAIGLSYARKFEAVMEDFDLADYCHDIETFDVDRITAQVGELSASYNHVRAKLADGMTLPRARLIEQEHQLADRIFSSE